MDHHLRAELQGCRLDAHDLLSSSAIPAKKLRRATSPAAVRCTRIYIRLLEAVPEAVHRRGKSPKSTAWDHCARIEILRGVYIDALRTWLSDIAKAVLHAECQVFLRCGRLAGPETVFQPSGARGRIAETPEARGKRSGRSPVPQA
jgi:hypothetical protein